MILMQYKKFPTFTINKNQICELIAIRRTNHELFKSGIALAFRTQDGCNLA